MPLLPDPQPYDPSARQVTCEAPGCGVVKPLGDMASFVVTLALTADNGPARQCKAVQHFGCTIKHARLVAHACLDEHFTG